MSWSNSIRQTHRWLGVAFTVAVIVTTVALARGNAADWVNYLALPPLGLLWFTGLYLFLQPYAARWRSGRRTG